MTATQQLSRDLGWGYFEKLAKQKVMQVQSAADPPKKLALGERAVMADGGEYIVSDAESRGEPIEEVYAVEGTPLITGPSAVHGARGQPQCGAAVPCLVDDGRGAAAQRRCRRAALGASAGQGAARPPKLADIKTLREEAAAVADQADEIKAQYVKLFKV